MNYEPEYDLKTLQRHAAYAMQWQVGGLLIEPAEDGFVISRDGSREYLSRTLDWINEHTARIQSDRPYPLYRDDATFPSLDDAIRSAEAKLGIFR